MLTGIKLINWKLSEFEDIAICYQHNVPTKLLSLIHQRSSNAISKLMGRTGLTALKKSTRGATRLKSRLMYDTLDSVQKLITSIRRDYSTQPELHQYLMKNMAQPRPDTVKTHQKISAIKVTKEKAIQNNKGNWTSLNHVISQGRKYGYDIHCKNLSALSNYQPVSHIIKCNGRSTTIHQLLLLVNRRRMQDKLSLLMLEGITNL